MLGKSGNNDVIKNEFPNPNKKKFISLEQASKISGYTEDYILRIAKKGGMQSVELQGKTYLELDSLLRETGTILLNYEGVDIIEMEPATPAENHMDETETIKQSVSHQKNAAPNPPAEQVEIPGNVSQALKDKPDYPNAFFAPGANNNPSHIPVGRASNEFDAGDDDDNTNEAKENDSTIPSGSALHDEWEDLLLSDQEGAGKSDYKSNNIEKEEPKASEASEGQNSNDESTNIKSNDSHDEKSSEINSNEEDKGNKIKALSKYVEHHPAKIRPDLPLFIDSRKRIISARDRIFKKRDRFTKSFKVDANKAKNTLISGWIILVLFSAFSSMQLVSDNSLLKTSNTASVNKLKDNSQTLQNNIGASVALSAEPQDLNKTIETIKGSFSDEVIVTFREDRNEGTIQPVFRSGPGEIHLYLIGPESQ